MLSTLVFFLVTESLNLGEAGLCPAEALGLGTYRNRIDDAKMLGNTACVAGSATIMAMLQTATVFVAVIFLLRITRRYSGEPA